MVLLHVKKRSAYRIPFEQYPAVRIVLLFMIGISTANYSNFSLSFLLLACFSCLLIFAILERISSRSFNILWSRLSTILFLLFISLSGASFFTLHHAKENSISATEKLIQISDWETITLNGYVKNISKNSAGKTRLDVEISKTTFSDSLSLNDIFDSRILWDVTETISMGDQFSITATTIPISEVRNPSAFNYKAFLESRKIYTQLRADSVLSIKENKSFFNWISLREKALHILDLNFDETTSPIAKALLLGYKNELETSRKQAFARAGLSHIMAVSGLHVGLIVAPFWLFIPFFWTKKYGTTIGLFCLVALLIFYAGITGFSAPVLRASLMATLLTYGKLFSKSADSINLMGVAAFVILLINPQQLFEIGFQLSFSAVLIILLIIPVVQQMIPYWIRIKWYGAPIMVIIISLIVQLGLYPMQAYYFGEVSIISPIANALFVPFLGIIVPLSLVALLISTLFPTIGFFVNYPSLLFLNGLNDFVQLTANFSWAWIKASKPSSLIFVFWSFFVLMLGSWRNPALKWKLMIASIVALCVIQINQLVIQLQSKKLSIIVFDVGQGDAALVQTPLGKNLLIDAGVWSPGSNSGKQILLPYFKENDIQKLDGVFLSHPHADHIGGIIDLINGIAIDTIYNSGYSYDSNLYRNYLQLAHANNIPIKSISAGETITLDPSILILTLGPEGVKYNNDPNQHSLVLNIIYGENEFLFTGDAGEDQERRLVENYGDLLDTDFLKVGHHGSKTSSELFFLDEVTPEIAVVSVAEKNRFKHPHQEAVARLDSSKAEIYFTSRDKGLVFESNGINIRRINWK